MWTGAKQQARKKENYMQITKEVRDGLLDEIKESLENAAKELSACCCFGRRDWTNEILERLSALGKKNRQSLCCGVAPDSENKIGEWLYDLIWWTKVEKGDGVERMGEVVLVLESEWSWSPFDVRYDFQKLIQAKSYIKVFISDMLSDETQAQLREDVECFKQKDVDESSRYLFAMYDHKIKNFSFKCINDFCSRL
jgi:hypothetical protein